MKSVQTYLIMLLIAFSAYSKASLADFRYETNRILPVDISLVVPAGETALLNFYSKGENGLRLLENDFTDAQGHYVGELQLPMHLNEVTLVVRTADRQDTYTLAIDNNMITYSE